MANQVVPRGNYQSFDEKISILKTFVSHYQVNISLSISGFLEFNAFGVIIEIDISKCIVLSSGNVLYIRWMELKNYIVVNIEA
jgi:hypothetical protein